MNLAAKIRDRWPWTNKVRQRLRIEGLESQLAAANSQIARLLDERAKLKTLRNAAERDAMIARRAARKRLARK